MTPELAIIFGGVLAFIVILGVALGGGTENQRRRKRRVDSIAKRTAAPSSTATQGYASVKREKKDQFSGIERMIKPMVPRSSALNARLERTGKEISIGLYILINFAVTIVVGMAVAYLAGLPPMVSALIGTTAGIGLPHFWVGFLANRRVAKFNATFPDAIDLIVRGLKSGLPVSESIGVVGREMPDPVGIEFRRIRDGMNLGVTMEEVMWETAGRLAIPEFKFFVISLSVQRETGGNLTETLANLSDILRKRLQMRLKVRAMSSEARASAMILGSLPALMFALIYFLSPDYESALLFDPRGRMMLGGAVGVMGIGMLVMRKMVRFEI